nr:hypothetical protein [Nocardia sp. CC227C]
MMRQVQGNNTSVTTGMTRYGFTSGSSGMEFVLDGSGALLQRIVSLPGGVVLTKNYSSSQSSNWSYPNIHGDILFTAGDDGVRTGKLHLYDPFGQNIDPDTGKIGDIPSPKRPKAASTSDTSDNTPSPSSISPDNKHWKWVSAPTSQPLAASCKPTRCWLDPPTPMTTATATPSTAWI